MPAGYTPTIHIMRRFTPINVLWQRNFIQSLALCHMYFCSRRVVSRACLYLLHLNHSSLGARFTNAISDLARIKDVVPGMSRWTITVVVHDIEKPHQSTSSPKRYQRIVFADASGKKVMATIFDSDISKFEKVFVLFQTYKISNAKLTPLSERYNKFGYPYQCIMTARTAISREVSSVIPTSTINLNFASLGNFHSGDHGDELKDVLVLVIDKMAARNVVASGKDHIVRDFVIINQEKRPLILTLWNDVAESEGTQVDLVEENIPIIRATHLAVSSFYNNKFRPKVLLHGL